MHHPGCGEKSWFTFQPWLQLHNELCTVIGSRMFSNCSPGYESSELDAMSNLFFLVLVAQRLIAGNVYSSPGTCSDISTVPWVLITRLVCPFIGYLMAFYHYLCKDVFSPSEVVAIRAINANRSLKEGLLWEEYHRLSPSN